MFHKEINMARQFGEQLSGACYAAPVLFGVGIGIGIGIEIKSDPDTDTDPDSDLDQTAKIRKGTSYLPALAT